MLKLLRHRVLIIAGVLLSDYKTHKRANSMLFICISVMCVYWHSIFKYLHFYRLTKLHFSVFKVKKMIATPSDVIYRNYLQE